MWLLSIALMGDEVKQYLEGGSEVVVGYKVSANATETVRKGTDAPAGWDMDTPLCKEVTNGYGDDLWVPFKTEIEWTEFIDHAEENEEIGLSNCTSWETVANGGSAAVDNGKITLMAYHHGQIPTASYDLGPEVSTISWVLRWKAVFASAKNSNSFQAEGFQVGLFDKKNFIDENPYGSVDGAFIGSSFHAFDDNADHKLLTWDSDKQARDMESFGEPYTAIRYFELKRNGHVISGKAFSDEYSTSVGSTATDTIIAANFTDLQYINVRIYRQDVEADNIYVVSEMEFWNNTTIASGTPTYELK